MSILTVLRDIMLADPRASRAQVAAIQQRSAPPMYPQYQIGKPQYPARSLETYDRDAYRKSALVFRCVQYVSSAAGAAPIRLDRLVDGEPEQDTDNDLSKLFRQPNPGMGESRFISFVAMNMLVAGFSVVEKERDSLGRIVRLWPLRTDWLRWIPRADGMVDWEYKRPGSYESRILLAEDVIPTPYADVPNGSPTGIGPLEVMLREIGISAGLTDFLKTFLDRGALPLYALIPSDDPQVARQWMDPAMQEAVKEAWRQRYQGLGNAVDPLPLAGVKDVRPIGMDFNQLAYPALNDLTDARICCLPETEIITKRGVVPIPEVCVGDEVLTHQGRWKRVTRLYVNPSEGRPIVEVVAKGLAPLRVTADHPVHTGRYSQSPTHKSAIEQFTWIGAGSLKAKATAGPFDSLTVPLLEDGTGQPVTTIDEVARNRFQMSEQDGRLASSAPGTKSLPATIPLSVSFGRLLGYFMAEGSTAPDKVVWYFAREEHEYQQHVLDDLQEVLGLEGCRVETPTCTSIVVRSSLLSRLLDRGTQRHRHLPEWSWNGDKAFHAALLQAWINGDGSEDDTRVRGSTRSKSLAWDMRLLALSLGIPASIQSEHMAARVIDGRKLPSGTVYTVLWRKNRMRTGTYRIDGGHCTSPVRSVTPIAYDGPVYNLEVEGDHSYLTTGGMVHNCMGFGVSPILIDAQVGLQQSTYSNKTEARRSFYEDTMTYLWSRLDDAFTRHLLPEFVTDPTYNLSFDTSDIPALKDDRDKRMVTATTALRAGGLTINSFLGEVGMKAVDGGDVFLIPGGVNPVREDDLKELGKVAEGQVSDATGVTTSTDAEADPAAEDDAANADATKSAGEESKTQREIVRQMIQDAIENEPAISEYIRDRLGDPEARTVPPPGAILITESDVDMAVDWFDGEFPELAGLLSASLVSDEGDD